MKERGWRRQEDGVGTKKMTGSIKTSDSKKVFAESASPDTIKIVIEMCFESI